MMRINVKREAFLKSLLAVSRAIPTRTTKDVYKNILMVVSSAGRVELTATNGEIGMRIAVPEVDAWQDEKKLESGRALINARVLDVLREATGETAKIETDSKGIWITTTGASSGEFQLLAEDAGDYPDSLTSLGSVDFEDSAFVIPAAEFRKLFRRTIFAVDEHSTRFALAGINVEFNMNRQVRFVATDTRRLSLASAEFTTKGGNARAPEVAPVIPSKAMKLVDAQADSGEVEVSFSSNGNQVRFVVGPVMIQAGLIQGRFPDYRKVIPTKFANSFKTVAAPFLAAVRQAMLVREKEGATIKFGLRKGFLKFSSEVAEFGASIVELPLDYAGENFNALFDPAFFSEFLKSVDGGTAVEVKLNSDTDPALLEADGFSYIVMPIDRGN